MKLKKLIVLNLNSLSAQNQNFKYITFTVNIPVHWMLKKIREELGTANKSGKP